MSSSEGVSNSGGRSSEELASQVRLLEAEVSDLRRRLTESPAGSRGLELRLADAQRSLAGLTSQNERLAQTLREARDQIMKLKEEVDRLAQPPAGFGTFLSRKMRPEGVRQTAPQVAFVRDAGGALVLRGYMVERRGAVEAYWLEPPRGKRPVPTQPSLVRAPEPNAVWLLAAITP